MMRLTIVAALVIREQPKACGNLFRDLESFRLHTKAGELVFMVPLLCISRLGFRSSNEVRFVKPVARICYRRFIARVGCLARRNNH